MCVRAKYPWLAEALCTLVFDALGWGIVGESGVEPTVMGGLATSGLLLFAQSRHCQSQSTEFLALEKATMSQE